jgi:hypothetical protein
MKYAWESGDVAAQTEIVGSGAFGHASDTCADIAFLLLTAAGREKEVESMLDRLVDLAVRKEDPGALAGIANALARQGRFDELKRRLEGRVPNEMLDHLLRSSRRRPYPYPYVPYVPSE